MRPWEALSEMLSTTRRERMLFSAARRTYKLRLVLQDTYHAHNLSACIRTAEAFGVQNIDLVSLQTGFKTTGVSRGVERWLDINRFSSIHECGSFLRTHNFHLTAASLGGDFPTMPSFTLETLPLGLVHPESVAIIFGNEKAGIHSDWGAYLNSTFTIPMVGLVESLNVSVCAAIGLHHLSNRLESIWGTDYRVTRDESRDLLDLWVCRHFPHWRGLMRRLGEAPIGDL